MTKTTENSGQNARKSLPWIIGALLILGAAVWGGIYWNRTGNIGKVQYTGMEMLNEEQLRQQVDIPMGVHPDSVNFIAIMQKIEQIPYVKKARINMQPGGTMILDIDERTPIALLVDGQKRAYVDEEGMRLQPVLGKTPDVPILYGFNAEPMTDTLQSEAFKEVRNFLQILHKRKVSDATISEVAWTRDEGVVTLTNENGVKLLFGNGAYDNRLRNWEAFYREVVRKKGIHSIKSVDLRFNGQIVTREK